MRIEVQATIWVDSAAPDADSAALDAKMRVNNILANALMDEHSPIATFKVGKCSRSLDSLKGGDQ